MLAGVLDVHDQIVDNRAKTGSSFRPCCDR